MSRVILARIVWLACLAVGVAGCHTAGSPPPETTASDDPAVVEAEADPPQAKKAEPAPAVASKAMASRTFTPPYPNRTDLFQPPERAEGSRHQGEATDGLVELKGFVNVDEPRVVLSIDGAIAPLPEGGEKYGVQVISINPPSVTLQRGRNRWTASLD